MRRSARSDLVQRSPNGLRRFPERILRAILSLLRVEGVVHIAMRALRDEGWLRSYRARLPVSRAGLPLPWYTYPATSFLTDRLPPDAEVFEYGAGHSTLWFASRCHRVASVESSARWYEDISRRLPPNAEVVLRTDKHLYTSEIARQKGPFDVIVIDGEWREACAREAIQHLTPTGIIIWDNSDMPEFGFDVAFREVLLPAGFQELEMRGLGPVVAFVWSTSILYRPGNILGI